MEKGTGFFEREKWEKGRFDVTLFLGFICERVFRVYKKGGFFGLKSVGFIIQYLVIYWEFTMRYLIRYLNVIYGINEVKKLGKT